MEGDEPKARKLINLPWQKNYVYGRQDPKKPFFTPWKPRPFLSPFAILPHHLEISFKTCHAVYLRDPVARPGQSEVISPFDVPVHERAYMYYLRNGKWSSCIVARVFWLIFSLSLHCKYLIFFVFKFYSNDQVVT